MIAGLYSPADWRLDATVDLANFGAEVIPNTVVGVPYYNYSIIWLLYDVVFPLSIRVAGFRFWSFKSGLCRATIGASMTRIQFCGNTEVVIDSSS